MTRVRRRFAVLGDPVDHSLSPPIYSAAFRELALDATYEARRVPANRADLLASNVIELAATGGGNVTLPHKPAAARLVDVLLPAAEQTGAVNCFWIDAEGRLVGDNTDVGGFRAAIEDLGEFVIEGVSVLVLGAGGAARAVALVCATGGAARLDVLNRSAARAQALVAAYASRYPIRAVTSDQVRQVDYDLVVNATSVGVFADDPLPISLTDVSTRYALDLVYGAGGTPWTAHAESLGIPARDGLSMLVRQAVLSLDRWFELGSTAETIAPVMLDAARAALARPGT